MLTLETLVSFVSWKSIISMASPALLILPLITLAGCADDGGGGPMASSLSTATDARSASDSDQASHSAVADSADSADSAGEDPTITMTPTPARVTAHVTWDRPSDFNATGYYIYYGKLSPEELRSEESRVEESPSEDSSPEEPSSCSRGESQAVEAPPATITGLEPNTPYFFAILAVNGSESLCSNEITAVTPPAES